MRYFKKERPRTPIYLPNGSQVKFETNDGITGYYESDDPNLINHFLTLIREKRGGIAEITAAEFQEGKKKADSTPSKPSWREEFGGGFMPDTLEVQPPVTQPTTTAPAAVVKPLDTPGPDPVAQAPKKPARPPNVGKRPS